MLALPFKCATLQFDSGYSPGLIDTLDFDTLRTQLDSGVQNDATNAFVPKRT